MKVKKFLKQFHKHTIFEVIEHKERIATGTVQDFLESCPESECLKKEVKKVKLNKNEGIAGLEGSDYPYLEIIVSTDPAL